MTGMITPNNKDGWDPENETFAEFKSRKTSHSKSISQPNSVIKQRGECKVTGIPKRKCSCRTCINRRNRSKGRAKQNAVRKKYRKRKETTESKRKPNTVKGNKRKQKKIKTKKSKKIQRKL